MLKRQICRSLVLALTPLAVAEVAAGQDAPGSARTCSPRVTARKSLLLGDGRGIVVDLTGIAAKDSEVALVGNRTTLFGSGGNSADSLLGVIWSITGGVVGIPIPGGHRPVFPKIAPSSTGWDVAFFEAPRSAPGGTLTEATVWAAHFNGTWTSVTRIAEFAGKSVHAGFASELIASSGTLSLLLNFEAEASAPSDPAIGFLLLTRAPSGAWSRMEVPARTGPGGVALSPGSSDHTGPVIGVVEPPLIGQRFRAPSLGVRLGPNASPMWFGDGNVTVRTPTAALTGSRLMAAWSTSAERQTAFYASAHLTRPETTRPRRLDMGVADGPRLVGFDSGAALFGLDASASRSIRIWWLGGDADASLRDSVSFPRSVFKYSIAKSKGGLLYIAALQVPTLGMSGDPSMEVVSVAMSCGSQER
jgi:hypothetical protein